MPHIHLGIVDGAKIFAFVLLFGTLWRLIAGWLNQSPIGQAMAVMY